MSDTNAPLELTPRETRQLLDAGGKIFLIDVREPPEHQTARIEGAQLIPMRTVPANLARLEALAEEGALVIFCHHGMRSLQVAAWLREQGIAVCQSMSGGIEQWSCEIDPSVPRY